VRETERVSQLSDCRSPPSPASTTGRKSKRAKKFSSTIASRTAQSLATRRTRTYPRLTPAQKHERLRKLIYLYQLGVSSTDCGRACNISKQRVLQLLRRADVPRRLEGNLLGRRDEIGRFRPLSAPRNTHVEDVA